MNKYDLNSLELSSKYHDTNKLLDSQIQYKLKETDKNFNTVNNHTAEATVFLCNNIKKLEILYNDQKYFTRRYKILGYLISAYPKANQNKLSKQLRKFKYFSQDFLLVLFAVFYAILFFGTTFIFHGIGKNGILIFFENFLFPLIAIALSWFITMVIITITEK